MVQCILMHLQLHLITYMGCFHCKQVAQLTHEPELLKLFAVQQDQQALCILVVTKQHPAG